MALIFVVAPCFAVDMSYKVLQKYPDYFTVKVHIQPESFILAMKNDTLQYQILKQTIISEAYGEQVLLPFREPKADKWVNFEVQSELGRIYTEVKYGVKYR